MFRRSLTVAALIALAIPALAFAAEGTGATQFGPRVGLSSSPDQLVLGGQLEFAEFAPNLTVDPNLELGFLDHRTTVAINGDFYYHFAIANTVWAPYAGLGVGLNVTQFDPSARELSSTDVGANLVFGASVPTRSGNRFLGELRVGLGDIPQLKLVAGWNFRM
jgi:hypothetical protein